MAARPCVSVITVTYQSRQHIQSCLDNLFHTAKDWIADCIVADNCSNDGSVCNIESRYDRVRVVRNSENLGYGRAINIASNQVKGDYLLILNPDAILHEGAVEGLVSLLDHRPQAAACGPKLLSPSKKFRYESRRGFPTPFNSFAYISGLDRLFPTSKSLGSYQKRWLSPEFEVATDSLSGSCMLLRRSAFEAVGGFDEDYFLFGEDIDLCWRLRHLGHEIWYVPTAVVTHVKGASMTFAPGVARREFYRSMLIYMDKRLAPEHTPAVMWAARLGVKLAAALSGKYRFSSNGAIPTKNTAVNTQLADGKSAD